MLLLTFTWLTGHLLTVAVCVYVYKYMRKREVSVQQSVHLPLCLPVCVSLSACLSVCVSASLHACLLVSLIQPAHEHCKHHHQLSNVVTLVHHMIATSKDLSFLKNLFAASKHICYM